MMKRKKSHWWDPRPRLWKSNRDKKCSRYSTVKHSKAIDYWALWSFENVNMTTWWRIDERGRSAADLDGWPWAGPQQGWQMSRCCRSCPRAPLSPQNDRWATSSKLRLHAEPKQTRKRSWTFGRLAVCRFNSHLWASVQPVQEMRLTSTSQAGDNVR